MKKNILIVGCGDVGSETGKALQAMGHGVFGIKRTPVEGFPFTCLSADISNSNSVKHCFQQLPDDIHFVIYTVAPSERSEGAYRSAYPAGISEIMGNLDLDVLEGFLLVTSTAVYHQSQGEWVDELSDTMPESFSGKILLEAEALLHQRTDKGVAIRFGGIYGPGRLRLLNKIRQGCELNQFFPAYTNRIHRDDCARMLVFLITSMSDGKAVDSCYIGVDSCPSTEWEVLTSIASMLSAEKPVHNEQLVVTNQNKRCRNSRIRELGFEFTYDSYLQGYQSVIDGM
ncbi:hypothetical protein A9Q99_15095 [Gammaproteobacteria bacterium 45_16_T64]|nr:hypothetical protein A9Q99_15095 [Gammaproteobacteria bacterium 45_16_T64]